MQEFWPFRVRINWIRATKNHFYNFHNICSGNKHEGQYSSSNTPLVAGVVQNITRHFTCMERKKTPIVDDKTVENLFLIKSCDVIVTKLLKR